MLTAGRSVYNFNLDFLIRVTTLKGKKQTCIHSVARWFLCGMNFPASQVIFYGYCFYLSACHNFEFFLTFRDLPYNLFGCTGDRWVREFTWIGTGWWVYCCRLKSRVEHIPVFYRDAGERWPVQYRDESGTGETDGEEIGTLSGWGLEIGLTVGFIGALPGWRWY